MRNRRLSERRQVTLDRLCGGVPEGIYRSEGSPAAALATTLINSL